MSTPQKMTRRSMLQLGVGVAVGAVASNLSAQAGDGASCGGTPVQTEGPFFPKHDQADKDPDLTLIEGHKARAKGKIIYVSGQVLDELCNPVAGALVDVWQANTHGRYHHEDDPNPAPLDNDFQGWGQFKTDKQGNYRFKTIVPGAYPVNAAWWRPPHIHFKVAKRGYDELTTQMYFAGHALNDEDRLLLALPQAERGKVIVEFSEGPASDEPAAMRGEFNIVLSRVGEP